MKIERMMVYSHPLEWQELQETIRKMYLEGFSSQEIKEKLQIPLNVRQVQRWIKSFGIARSVKDSFHNAMKRGRITWVKKKSIFHTHRPKLSPTKRYKILTRDNFRCVKCGATASDRLLEVDHKDSNPENQKEDNLETLCEYCNIGKPSPNRKNYTTLSGKIIR